jgi:hypothetical protein
MSSLQAQALCNGILDDINSIFVSRYVDFFGVRFFVGLVSPPPSSMALFIDTLFSYGQDAAHTVGAKRRNAFNRMRSSDAAARCGITSHLVEMWPCGSTFVTDEDRLYLTHVKDMTVCSLVESEIWDAGNQSVRASRTPVFGGVPPLFFCSFVCFFCLCCTTSIYVSHTKFNYLDNAWPSLRS